MPSYQVFEDYDSLSSCNAKIIYQLTETVVHMKRWVLDVICCPECRGNFILSETKGNDIDITEGILTCIKCGRTYPISDGIANLLPDAMRINNGTR